MQTLEELKGFLWLLWHLCEAVWKARYFWSTFSSTHSGPAVLKWLPSPDCRQSKHVNRSYGWVIRSTAGRPVWPNAQAEQSCRPALNIVCDIMGLRAYPFAVSPSLMIRSSQAVKSWWPLPLLPAQATGRRRLDFLPVASKYRPVKRTQGPEFYPSMSKPHQRLGKWPSLQLVHGI